MNECSLHHHVAVSDVFSFNRLLIFGKQRREKKKKKILPRTRFLLVLGLRSQVTINWKITPEIVMQLFNSQSRNIKISKHQKTLENSACQIAFCMLCHVPDARCRMMRRCARCQMQNDEANFSLALTLLRKLPVHVAKATLAFCACRAGATYSWTLVK